MDTLGSRLGNAGGNDERQRQRVLQFTQNIRQADDATADLALKIEALGDIPEDEAKEAAVKKREWQKERTHRETIATELDDAKAETDRQVRGVESDIATAIQKRERLQQRQARLNEQHERLIIANNEGYTAKQRKDQESKALLQERMIVESQYRSNINSYERRANEYHMATSQMMSTIQHFEALLQQQAQHPSSVPATPDGHLHGTNLNMSPHANPFQSFTFPSYNNNTSTPGSLRGGRGRSSSMLSNISGFTDGFSDDFASPSVHHGLGHPFHATSLLNGRKGSHGSGSLSSGTSSQSSSQRDPLSPLPNVKPVMARASTGGTIGMASPISNGR